MPSPDRNSFSQQGIPNYHVQLSDICGCITDFSAHAFGKYHSLQIGACFNIPGLKDYFLPKYYSINAITFHYYISCSSKITCVLGYEVFK